MEGKLQKNVRGSGFSPFCCRLGQRFAVELSEPGKLLYTLALPGLVRNFGKECNGTSERNGVHLRHGATMMATTPSGKNPEDPPEQLGEAPSFEQTASRLEEIVHLLEEGKIGLDEALARYEEGVGLLRKAYDLLEKAQRRISLLSGVDSAGNPILRPIDDAASFSLERDATTPPSVEAIREKASGRRGRRPTGQDPL